MKLINVLGQQDNFSAIRIGNRDPSYIRDCSFVMVRNIFSKAKQLFMLVALLTYSLNGLYAKGDLEVPLQSDSHIHRVPVKATPFDLQDVQLLDGPFKQAQDVNRKLLLNMDTDRARLS